MKTNTVIAPTTKGHRIFLEGLSAVGWHGGSRYTVDYTLDTIILMKALPDTVGKTRKVTASKGGVIDLESKRITKWAKGSESVSVQYDHNHIIIERVVA
jgi:hypothetical protein